MDVKFKNGLRNCAPSKIEGYGKYAWTKGAAERFKNTPKLPDELFEMKKGCPAPTTNNHHYKEPKGRSDAHNNNRHNDHRHPRGVAGYQGSLQLPLHLPAGQLHNLDPSRHDPQDARRAAL